VRHGDIQIDLAVEIGPLSRVLVRNATTSADADTAKRLLFRRSALSDGSFP